MSANNLYRVIYHFEKNGKRCSDTAQDTILASDSTFSSLSTVLTNNSKTNNGQGTLVIESVGHVGASFLS